MAVESYPGTTHFVAGWTWVSCNGSSADISGWVPPESPLFSFGILSSSSLRVPSWQCCCQRMRSAAVASRSSGLMLHFLSEVFSWSLYLFLGPPARRWPWCSWPYSTLRGSLSWGILTTWPSQRSWCWVIVASILLHTFPLNNKTGESANAVPHYHKLCSWDSHIWGIHPGQHSRSAMAEPRQRWTAFLITVSPLPGKYEFPTICMGHSLPCTYSTGLVK